MDACHILLGRPWIYNRRVKHDGYRNTYTFKKDGVSITFAPLNPKNAPPDRVLISKTDFVGLVKVSPPSVVFGLLMIEENPVTAAAPLSMVPLLNEFKDVFPEEIPAGPFFIVYGCNPFTPLDLAPMVGDGLVSAERDERAHQIKALHAQRGRMIRIKEEAHLAQPKPGPLKVARVG
nr:reverse transcriptase domain-containing protein [Tanacetum cinerariifolium]